MTALGQRPSKAAILTVLSRRKSRESRAGRVAPRTEVRFAAVDSDFGGSFQDAAAKLSSPATLSNSGAMPTFNIQSMSEASSEERRSGCLPISTALARSSNRRGLDGCARIGEHACSKRAMGAPKAGRSARAANRRHSRRLHRRARCCAVRHGEGRSSRKCACTRTIGRQRPTGSALRST